MPLQSTDNLPHLEIQSVNPSTIGSAVLGGTFYGQVTNPVQHIIVAASEHPDGSPLSMNLSDQITSSDGDRTVIHDNAVFGTYSIENPKGYRVGAACVYVLNDGDADVIVSGRTIAENVRVLFMRKHDGSYVAA